MSATSLDIKTSTKNDKISNLLNKATLSTTLDFYNYLMYDFSQIFFTPGQYAQQKMKIVGPIRIRALHTNPRKNCTLEINAELGTCLYTTIDTSLPETVNKNKTDQMEY